MKEKKEIGSQIYPFEIDKINGYAWFDSAFTKEECEEIIRISKNKKLQRAGIGSNNKNSKNYRDSSIVWLYPYDELDWAFQRVTNIVLGLNKDYFNFNLYGFIEGFQFTNYKAPTGKYKKHVDREFGTRIRKLSISIQLTDETKYEGGELCLHYGEDPIKLKKTQGTLFAFPSFVLHEVMPVTKGERNSLVAWITGDNFK
jgi:PKHD-type hydroxylase